MADIFDADVALALEVSYCVEGNESYLNRFLLDKAYPGVWDRITDKFLAVKDEDEVFQPTFKRGYNDSQSPIKFSSPTYDYASVKADIDHIVRQNKTGSETQTPTKKSKAKKDIKAGSSRSISETPK